MLRLRLLATSLSPELGLRTFPFPFRPLLVLLRATQEQPNERFRSRGVSDAEVMGHWSRVAGDGRCRSVEWSQVESSRVMSSERWGPSDAIVTYETA